jgi:hypothetical protein
MNGDDPVFPAVYTATIEAPPAPAPIFGEIPPPVLIEPEPLPLLVIALAAGAIIDKPPRPKKEPLHKPEDANKKVLKVKDAYEVIDKVIKSKEIGICLLKMLPALWHIQQAHFPAWVDIAAAEDDINNEVTERLRNKLKDEMFEKALGQDNPRVSGKWNPSTRGLETIDFGGLTLHDPFPINIKIRKGKLHGLSPPRGGILPA